MRLASICLFIFISTHSIAQLFPKQNREIDSLKNIISTSKSDTIKIKALLAWDNIIYLVDPELDFQLNVKVDSICSLNLKKKLKAKEEKYFKKIKANCYNIFGLVYNSQGKIIESRKAYLNYIKLCQEMGDENMLSTGYNNLGNSFKDHGEFDTALIYLQKGLEIENKNKDTIGKARILLNIGMVYSQKKDLNKALALFNKSLKLLELGGSNDTKPLVLNCIGNIYYEQKSFEKAIKSHKKGLKISRQLGNPIFESGALANIGICFQDKVMLDSAKVYHHKSLEIRRQIGDMGGVSQCLNNLGVIEFEAKNYDEAINYFNECLTIAENRNDSYGLSVGYNNLGRIELEKKNYSMSVIYNQKALDYAKISNSVIAAKFALGDLFKAYKGVNNFESALESYVEFIELKDSLESEENKSEILKQEFRSEYEMKALSDSLSTLKENEIKNERIARGEAELSAKRNQQYALFGGLFLTVIFAGFIFNRFRITKKQKIIIEIKEKETQKQNKIITEQKILVEEQNKEIKDSITYAKRIQSAILPQSKLVLKYLPNSFILYNPKDIVAGDFYWMESVNDTILYAAADCTGHGVPGAMVSVVCNNALNRVVREYGITSPEKILDKTRELVIQEFEKSEEEVKDGMDISLCSLSIPERKLVWAGANNPLWLVSNGEIMETKPDKQPIGKYAAPLPFTKHEIELQIGDTIYIFTDGFQDQFGGEKGKKFKAANLKQLLLNIQSLSMEEQKGKLIHAFNEWKGELEQVDDVCIIGVRI